MRTPDDAHHIYRPDIDIVSIDSTDATVSDIPGPGRTLGKAFTLVGTKIEHSVNRFAKQRKLGPVELTRRIERRRRDENGILRSSTSHDDDELSQLKKDLKKLLRYSRSKTESTKKQALNGLTRLAARDEYLQQLLRTSNADQVLQQHEPQIWDFCDSSVHLSSWLAQASIRDELQSHYFLSDVATSSGSRLPYAPELDIVSIESSNATESDLPGPGRNLGKLYAWLGANVERASSRFAEWRGLGPNELALDINCRRFRGPSYKYIENISDYGDQEAMKQKKDIKKLIRYSKSKTESTRKQALDSMFELAMWDKNLLAFLKELNALKVIKQQEPYIWDFCDSSVQISSRLVLACVQEQEIFHLVKDYRKERTLRPIMNFIQENPEHSFLAFRLLTYYARPRRAGEIMRILELANELITHSPAWVDWDAVDTFYKQWIGWYMRIAHLKLQSPYYLWNICCYETKFPRTFKSGKVRQVFDSLKKPQDCRSHFYFDGLITFCRENPNLHLPACLVGYNNPADLTLCEMARDYGEYRTVGTPLPLFVPATILTERSRNLASLVDSHDQHLAHRALCCIRFLLKHDGYAREALLHALSHTAFASSSSYPELVQSTGTDCDTSSLSLGGSIRLVAHYNAEKDFTHFSRKDSYEITETCSTFACATYAQLQFGSKDFMLVKIPRGTPITVPDSAIPIILNPLSTTDTPMFLAYTDERSSLAVYEGKTPEECRFVQWWYTASDGTWKETDEIIRVPERGVELCVLRYAPETYMRRRHEGSISHSAQFQPPSPYSRKALPSGAVHALVNLEYLTPLLPFRIQEVSANEE